MGITNFDFFNDNHKVWLRSFCEYFNLNIKEVDNYFKCIDIDRLTADIIIADLGINLNLYDSSKVKIVCRHMTTTTETGVKNFKEKGLLDLKRMLQLDTPLSEFLTKHRIWVDVDRKYIRVDNKIYPILAYGDSCDECFMNRSVKCTGYSKCDLRKKIEHLALKLYKYGATVECFINATLEGMERYSTINRCPEILDTLDNIYSKIYDYSSTGYMLCNDWLKENRRCYIIEYTSKLSDMETFAPIDYIGSFRSYSKCILNSGYDYDDYIEKKIPQRVFDNMIFIQWFISIYFYDSEKLGSLLPNKYVRADKIKVMEVKNGELEYID
ncbi:hypothetical protein [Clostridium sp.]|uniref:hypothetical protein n=1 Tax=Clostridium sp. TaxID=1506 RepID=UPI0025C10F57|nr:hypothetical protein [Clostridium sp.]